MWMRTWTPPHRNRNMLQIACCRIPNDRFKMAVAESKGGTGNIPFDESRPPLGSSKSWTNLFSNVSYQRPNLPSILERGGVPGEGRWIGLLCSRVVRAVRGPDNVSTWTLAMTSSKTLLVTSRFRVEEILRKSATGETQARAVVRHPGAVTILPMVDADHVCLIRNFRVAVGQTLIELPAGTLEAGETVESTAARELIEETGFRAGRLTGLHDFYLSPGVLDERMHLFLAEELDEVGAAREAGEEIENLVVPWHRAIQMVFDREIRDAKTIVGLLYADRLRGGRNS